MDKQFWNQRWIDRQTGWDIGEVSTPLKTFIDGLEDKTIRILIPGAGNGYEAEYLHRQGFTNVFLVDIAPKAIESFRARIPDFPVDHIICGDFFELDGHYDLMLEQTFFCALPPALRGDYAEKTASLLHSGGELVGVLFDVEMNDGPPFGGNRDEYRKLFSPLFNIEKMERCYNSIPPRQGREVFIRLRAK